MKRKILVFIILISFLLTACRSKTQKLLDEGERYYEDGLRYLEEDQIEKAFELFNQAVESDPSSAAAYTARGQIYSYHGEDTLALADFNKAIELDDQYARAYQQRGILYREQSNYDLALTDFNKAINLDPKLSDFFVSRGILHWYLYEDENAFRDFSEAIELDPKNVWGYYYRAKLFNDGYIETSVAIADLKRALKIDPKFVAAYAVLGDVYLSLDELAEARSAYENALDLSDEYAYALAQRGYIYYLEGDYDRSIEDLNHAVEIYPEYGDAYFRLGHNYLDLGRFNEAVEAYDHAVQIYGDDAQLGYYYRAVAYEENDNFDQAYRDYMRFLDNDLTDNEFTRYACERVNYIALWHSESLGEFLLNLFIGNPCSRYDTAYDAGSGTTDWDYEEPETCHYVPVRDDIYGWFELKVCD